MTTFYGILIPFLGTTLGAACVFFLRKALGDRLQRALTGFAAGVMVAASVWSLLIHRAVCRARPSFVPARRRRLLDRCGLPAAARPRHPPPAPQCRSGRGPAHAAAAHHHDAARGHTAQHPGGHGRRRRLRRIPDRNGPDLRRSRSASPSRISRRAPSSLCRCALRARAACAPSRAACSRASSSRSAQC